MAFEIEVESLEKPSSGMIGVISRSRPWTYPDGPRPHENAPDTFSNAKRTFEKLPQLPKPRRFGRIVLSQCAAARVLLDKRRHKYERQ